MLGVILEGPGGVRWRSPGVTGILGGALWVSWGPEGSLAGPWGVQGGPGGSGGGPWGILGGHRNALILKGSRWYGLQGELGTCRDPPGPPDPRRPAQADLAGFVNRFLRDASLDASFSLSLRFSSLSLRLTSLSTSLRVSD